ncbi:MAG: ArgE/DapE family deacylase [Candidatus Latescibacteria bacterium]|jgi:succinyl-diaminopimelate desuccinylase|nr:ArgE/DapE family deacylase [Candidatus Latescibacterota bacterium]MDP7447113.1 ArgE/DapE family deacylase [Candidatus Latescibacterota bacterium]HJP32963.1 ArgE/DapE family deacylase [Candidatus Latescibacterota bacterium]
MPGTYLDGRETYLGQALRRMVKIATVNPPGIDYRPMVEHLRDRLQALGMPATVHRVPDVEVADAGVDPAFPRYNVIARWDVGASRTVHFNAHYDVVPVAVADWKAAPFDGKVSSGWLYGRGAGDMKGSIVALLGALEALQATGTAPGVNVEVSFTADEETGGALGAGWIARKGLVRADYAIECEGASGSRVGVGHNGVLWLEVDVEGKAAHASSPDRGVNAFEKMALMVHQLQSMKRRLSAASRRWRGPDDRSRQPTINVGGCFGGGEGQKVNTVPARAQFTIDRRLVPGESLADAEAELVTGLAEAARRSEARHRVRSLLRIEPCIVDPRGELPEAFARSVRSVRRHAAGFRVTTGFTDLHYFVEDLGLPGIGYGVAGERAHGADERVSLRDLVQTARTYADFLVRGIE